MGWTEIDAASVQRSPRPHIVRKLQLDKTAADKAWLAFQAGALTSSLPAAQTNDHLEKGTVLGGKEGLSRDRK